MHCFCVRGQRPRAAALGPHRAPAARAALGRGRLRDGGEPRLRGRRVARAAPAAAAHAPRPGRGAASGGVASPPVAFDVVIAGGGFGGLYAARRLERRLPRHSARITVVSDLNFMLYTPLLPGAAAGTLEPRHVVVPLREELEWAELMLGRVTGADPGRQRALRAHPRPARRDAPLRPARRGAGLGLARPARARPRRARARLQVPVRRDRCAQPRAANLEIAESLPDDASRREYLTFVFVGAGYAGVEGYAELQDYVNGHHRRVPALPHRGHALGAGRGPGPHHARDPREPRGGRRPRAPRRGMEIRTGTTLERHGRAERRAVHRRAPAHAARLLDGGRPHARHRQAARPAAHRAATASRPTPRCG